MQKGLTVMKASAGSGKTHKLTERYVNMLLHGAPDEYRHILAVTFTNKATDEMKSRVIESLFKLSKADTADGKKARRILSAILHDYSGFSVSTIDTFFQNVMRSFAREIGQYASYKVELDESSVLLHAVDAMMSSLDEDDKSDLRSWLTEYALDLIEDGRSWNIATEMKGLASLFLKEDFKLKKRSLEDGGFKLFGDRDEIRNLKMKLNEIVTSFRDNAKKFGEEGLSLMLSYGIDSSSFPYSKSSGMTFFDKLASGIIEKPGKRTLDMVDDISKWSTKSGKSKDDQEVISAIYEELNALLKVVVELFGTEFVKYRTALIVRRNLYMLGIFRDIYENMEHYLRENNLVMLGESAEKLSHIIDGSDTPFIYEKLGTRYSHYMLDEFQDTSVLQWENMRPLVKDAVDSTDDNCVNDGNLIVGDVKQSIYRWRGSDWKLLDEKLKDDFPAPSVEWKSLSDNWRSTENVVKFNNDFFLNVGTLLKSYNKNAGEKIGKIYGTAPKEEGSCEQSIPENRKGRAGHVKAVFFDNEDDESVKEHLFCDIDSLRGAGYGYNDIAVLVRTNRQARNVAQMLMSSGIDVVTEEALLIRSSSVVGKVVCALNYAVFPENKINNLIASELGNETLSVADLDATSLYDLCEELVRRFTPGGVPELEIPFVEAFLDSVLSYSSRHGSSIPGFIQWWDENGSGKSVSAPKGSESVNVMTIHKSKGLGFKAVIIPYFKEEMSLKRNSFMWCIPKEEPFSEVGVIPVSISASGLADTLFEGDYNDELIQYCVDAVNTAYVAMTRAKNELVIYAKPVDEKGKINTVSDALYLHLKKNDMIDADGKYEMGTWWSEPSDEKEESSGPSDYKMKSFLSSGIGTRLHPVLRGTEYYEKERVGGIVRHDILSGVDVESDLHSSVVRAVGDGDVKAEDAESIESELASLIGSCDRFHWFDGTFRSLREISIVEKNGSVKRPDRVLVERGVPLGKGRAIVIDYKFGQRNDGYRRQVGLYMNLLREMGYSQVEGYIWYCKNNEIDVV